MCFSEQHSEQRHAAHCNHRPCRRLGHHEENLTAAAVDRDLGPSGRVSSRLGEGAEQRGQQFLNLQVCEGRRRDIEAALAGGRGKGIEVGCVARTVRNITLTEACRLMGIAGPVSTVNPHDRVSSG